MKAKLSLKWSRSGANAKLAKNALPTASFGLPAVKACPGAGACAAVCYATQGSYVWRTVREAREFNFRKAKRADFKNMLLADLTRIKEPVIRVHDSGDFFAQEYLEAWFAAARAFPLKTFYAYTKSLHLDFSGRPANFRIVQSLGGKFDARVSAALPVAEIFADETALASSGALPSNEHDNAAISGAVKHIGFVYHGTRKLTAPQRVYFSPNLNNERI